MKINKKINDAAKGRIERAWARIQNVLGEKGQGLVDELRGLFDEAEAAEAEISDDDLVTAVEGIIGKYKEVPEAVANAIAALKADLSKVRNSMTGEGKKLPVNVQNQIAKAVINCRTKDDVRGAVEAVLVKNEITGLTFGEVIDYNIVDGWGDNTGLFEKLFKTPVTKFFYTEDDLNDAAVLAKQWDKDSEEAKAAQVIAAEGKAITTKYIYKKQRIANEDLDAIEASGNEATFLRYITAELRRQWANSVIKAILVGDTTNAVGSRITTFETIGTKAADDLFTTITATTTPGTVTFGELWQSVQSVRDPFGYGKVLIIDESSLGAVASFVYASGGDADYRGIDELKAKLGVADIILMDLHGFSGDAIHAITLVPQGYWVNIKKEVEVAYPNWDFNQRNFLFERNAGGAIHDFKSTAVYKDAE